MSNFFFGKFGFSHQFTDCTCRPIDCFYWCCIS